MSENFIGTTVNGYEVISQIGQGGMATVFLAQQQSMNRNVALKFLPKHLMNDDTYMQRFEREVKIVSQLEHRNIVPVYDYGEYEGQPYIAMRYMPAGSVDDLLQAGRMPLDRILNIIEQIAPALDYAHSKGILHRDLKPSNILLDDGGGAFITDFGIARILSDQTTEITVDGVVGTPSYMSPEQAQASAVDGRSDVYSLGVMLFEMVTGRRPFEGDTPYGIAVMQVTTEPPSPKVYDPTVSSALESVILRALKKDPNKRYATASELAQALRLVVDSSQTHARSQSQQPHTDNMSETQASRTSGTSPVVSPSTPRSVGQVSQQKPKRKSVRYVMLLGILGMVVVVSVLLVGMAIIWMVSVDTPSDATPVSVMVTPVQVDINAVAQQTQDALTLPIATVADADEKPDVTPTARADKSDVTATAVSFDREVITPTTVQAFIPIGAGGTPTLSEDLQDVDGTLIYFDYRIAGANGGSFEVVTLDLSSWETIPITDDTHANTYPQPSPDGEWVAYQSDLEDDFDIYVLNLASGQRTKLTDNDVWDRLPAWSPDGEWVIYSTDSNADGRFDLYRTRPDGTDTELVYSDGRRNSHARYSSDGRYIVFTSGKLISDETTWDIALLDTTTSGVKLLTDNDVRDASPVFSPDDERILFITTVNDNPVVASMDLDGNDRRIVYDGEARPWAASYSPDGKYIVVTVTIDGIDQLLLMEANGRYVQQITSDGGAYASWMSLGAR